MAGYRTWSTGDTVTAADFTSYISSQVITVHTSTTTRDSAITSPAEGMFAFTKDADKLWYYSGSAWVETSLAGDISSIVTAAASGLAGGASSGDVTLTLNLAGLTAAQAFGSDGAGVDVTFHSGTAGDYAMWDASEEKLIIEGTNGATALDVTDGNVVIGDGTLTVGSDGAGEDVTFHSDTAGDYMQWDSSEEKLILEGTNGATVLDVTDGNVVIGDGTLTIGSDGAGEDVTFHSDTAGDYMQWDSSAEKLILEGTNGATVLDITDGNVVIGDGTLTVGSDGAGEDVTFYSDTAGDSMVWDSSAEKLTITGTDGATALDVPDGNVTVTDKLTVSGGIEGPLQINAQTGTTYTFVLADAGKLVTSSNGSAQTFTVPPNSSVAFPVGTQIIVQNIGSANCTLAQGSGVTINSKDSNKEISGQYASAALIKTATDAWSLIGALE